LGDHGISFNSFMFLVPPVGVLQALLGVVALKTNWLTDTLQGMARAARRVQDLIDLCSGDIP